MRGGIGGWAIESRGVRLCGIWVYGTEFLKPCCEADVDVGIFGVPLDSCGVVLALLFWRAAEEGEVKP